MVKRIDQQAFRNKVEFLKYSMVAPVVYFHIFEGQPDSEILRALDECSDDEALVLLDVLDDQGFLRDTTRTVEISTDHQFVGKPLLEHRGIGAWAKGTLVAWADTAEDMGDLLAAVQRFVFQRPGSGG